MAASLDYLFRQQSVLEGHLGPNDNLGNVLRGRDPKEFRTQIDLDAAFFRFTDVAVVCNANFDDDPVSLITAHLEYHGRGPNGSVDRIGDVQFTKTSGPQHFATYLAAPDQTTYSYEGQVIYKGTSDRFTFSGKDNKTVLVLDVDKLGVLRTDLQVGICDWEQIKQAEVQLWYGTGSDRRERRMVFDSQHQSGRWVEAIAKPVTEPYSYKVTWIDKTNQRLDTPTQTSYSRNLVLDAPLVQQLEVTLIPAGDFGSSGLIKSIAIALRYLDEDNQYRKDETVVITSDKDAKVWRVPLRNKNLRTFQYQQTIIYTGGGSRGTRELPWTSSDNPVVVVGDPYTFRVRMLPYLLKGGAWSFGTVTLSFDDVDDRGHALHFENDFELKDFTTPLEWHILLGNTERHTYRYQLTLYRSSDGTEVKGPQLEAEQEILVLAPPKP
jgi:hypothetical protein